jgi:cytochrome bd-type quinol oxidase subunit 2
MKKFAKYAMIAAMASAAFLPTMTSAQVTFESIGETLGLGNADLKETVINILQLVLGLLALIAVIMVIIGGFTWLTAGGNEEKVDKAKKIISAAVIGLIIVLLAWAIVIFVANTTVNVTNE